MPSPLEMIFSFRHLLLFAFLFNYSAIAKIGDDFESLNAYFGKPVYNEIKEKGLVYYRKYGLCIIAHLYSGHCDEVSIFSEKQIGGVSEPLSDERISFFLNHEGRQSWSRVNRFSMNELWNSHDGRLFAVYETMLHKLIIMTRTAYARDKCTQPMPLSSP